MRNIQFQSTQVLNKDKVDENLIKIQNNSHRDLMDMLTGWFGTMAGYGQQKNIIVVVKRARVLWRDKPELLIILIKAFIHNVSMATDEQYEFILFCLEQVKKIYDKENYDYEFNTNIEIELLKLDLKQKSDTNLQEKIETRFNNYLSDLDLISSKDYIYIYRGFHTYDESKIRMSNDKDSKKYFKQKEGAGVSYSLDKRLAYLFSTNIFSQVMFSNANPRALTLQSYNDYKTSNKFKNLPFGRATFARYLVRKKDLIFLSNMMSEREVTVHPDDVLLVDYKFISNKEYESTAFDVLKVLQPVAERDVQFTFDQGVKMIEQKDEFKNHWINTKWHQNSPIPTRIKKILEK